VTLPLERFGVNAFRLCGYVGLAAAIAVALTLTVRVSAQPLVELVLIAAAVGTFLTLAKLADALVYYHHEIAVLAVTTVLAAALGAPALVHLDATQLGLGAFLVCGRIGCLHVGCCHGRPASHGIVYAAEHAASGFPAYLVGRPLVPVQAVEAAGVLALVLAGSAAVFFGAPAGTGFAVYLGGYACLRFALELLRGDPGRRWWHGLTEAQWTSLAASTALAGLGLTGTLAGPGLVYLVPLALILPAAALQATGRIARPHAALDPRHVRELATALDTLEHAPSPSTVVSTSLGLRISFGTGGGCDHWTLSGASPPAARALAHTVLWLRRPDADAEILRGPADLLHVVVPH
jgi:Prolipoprotein diacylglyceryl transferase